MKCMKQRTIKFRGWFPEMKRMLYQDGDWCNCLEYATWSFPMCIDEGDEKRWNVNEECILMQFTGLLDKNGLKEVYEGDIIDIDGLIKGNIYEMDKGKTDLVIEGLGTSAWSETEMAGLGRGLQYAK